MSDENLRYVWLTHTKIALLKIILYTGYQQSMMEKIDFFHLFQLTCMLHIHKIPDTPTSNPSQHDSDRKGKLVTAGQKKNHEN